MSHYHILVGCDRLYLMPLVAETEKEAQNLYEGRVKLVGDLTGMKVTSISKDRTNFGGGIYVRRKQCDADCLSK